MITKFDSLYAGHTDLDNCGYAGTRRQRPTASPFGCCSNGSASATGAHGRTSTWRVSTGRSPRPGTS